MIMTDPTRARTPVKTTTTMAVTVDDQAYAKEASARCVGCGLIDKLDTIIQHASTCKITVVVKEEGNKGSQTHTHSSDSQTVSCQDLSWMPSSFSLLKRDGGYVSGIVHSEEELLTLLADHKRATLSSFNFWYNSEGRQRKAENVGKQRKLLWHVEDYREDTPLSVTKRVIMSCQHGKERKNTASTKGDSLAYVYTRKRHFEKRVKKLDCPAKVFIRHMKRLRQSHHSKEPNPPTQIQSHSSKEPNPPTRIQPAPPLWRQHTLNTHWMVCMDREQQLVEEAVIPTYDEWEAEEPESEDNPACADYECAKRLERCREANEKLTLKNRRLEVQLSELKRKYKLLERKHRGLCEATGVRLVRVDRGGKKVAVRKR